MTKEAWFCPACQKHHAPHVETCPGPVDVRPLPGLTIPPVYPVMPRYWEPAPSDTPWVPYPTTTCVVAVEHDPSIVVVN